MKKFSLFVALVAVLAYAGWRMGYIKLPGQKQQQETFTPGGGGGPGGGGPSMGGRRGGFDGPVVITAFDLRNADVPVTLDAIGTAQALNTVTVRSQVEGKLIEVAFKEGQDVKAGDVLARIDPTTYQAQYDQAVAKKAQDEAQLANARIDLERYTRLAQGNFGPKQQADTQRALVAQLEAQVRADQATIDNTKAVLGYTTIRSPLDGRTGIRLVDPGNLVQANGTNGIVVITQIKPIAVVFTLAQQNLRAVTSALAKGPLDAQAFDSGMTNAVARGQVTVVDNQVDPATGTVKIKAVFPNADLALWPGQFVNIRLTVDVLKNVVVAPSAAVQRGPNGAFVYVVKPDDTVAQTQVSIGLQNERFAVIQSGLAPPAKVATTGFARLRDGAKVRVIPMPQAGAEARSETAAPADAPATAAAAAPPRGEGAQGGDQRGRRRKQGGGPAGGQ
ncbi:MAG TPA: efflux RND transporter periplasmic adaptor subunit [Beijerinckiaceae bacterium]|nr:efflux RND transporter periplasmic adaptor subunit [Methylobacteriaceae bacterium]HRY03726.1 efflux RND transporter periplasmic adaptor subunit [Beijerinckiaceae bacterium]